MAKIPNNYRKIRNRPFGYMQPRKRRPKFRWWIVHFVLACLLAAWVLNHIEPAIGWTDIVDLSGVKFRRAYSKLGVL